jgi:hypothetical protein
MARAIAIRVHRGPDSVETLVFERDTIKIGRLPSMHLRLDDPKVSRFHAVINSGAEVAVVDMGTTEGVRVNGERVSNSRTRLQHGDEVMLGDTRLVMLLEASEVAGLTGAPVDVAAAVVPAPVSTASGVFASGSTDLEALRKELNRTVSNPAMSADVFAGAAGLPVTLTPTPLTVTSAISAPPAPAPVPPSFAAAATTPPTATAAASLPAMRAATTPTPLARTNTPHMSSVMPSLPPIAEDNITANNRYVEVSLRWMNTVTDVRRVRSVPDFVIGSGPQVKAGMKRAADAVDMFVPLTGGEDRFTLLNGGAEGWSVNFLPSMSGTITRGGQTAPLSSAGGAVPLTDDTEVQIGMGPFTIEVKPVAKSRAVPVVPFFDTLWVNMLVTSVFAGVAMTAVLTLLPIGMDSLDDDLLTNPTKFQALILKPPPKDNSFLEKIKGPSKQVAAAKNDAGKAGNKKADPNKDKGRMATKAPDKPTDEEVVANKLNALFGDKGKGGIASMFDGDAKGGALEAALGNIDGSKVAAGYGEGGMGFRGGGPGGGGTGTNTFGTGKVGTLGRGSGNSGYGAADGGMGKRDDRDVTMTQGNPTVMGSLDPEIIRRIVREHAGQIKYCYEKELIRTPGMAGKVIMKWLINGEGKVTQSLSVDTQLNNAAVESCLANRIKTWTFPKPKGGGTVIVNYPFVFKQGGG